MHNAGLIALVILRVTFSSSPAGCSSSQASDMPGRPSGRKRKQHEAQLVSQHQEKLDQIRKRSNFVIYGKKKEFNLSLYQHMENVVATVFEAKKKDMSHGGDCLVTQEVQRLMKGGWSDDEIEDAIAQALSKINKQRKIS